MKKQLIQALVFCAACLVAGAQAQNSSGSAGGSSTDPNSPSSSSPLSGASSSDSSGTSSAYRHLSATGRMGHHELRASQLTGAQITSGSGSEVGMISDVIINPALGRVDFAIFSLSSSGSSATSPSASSTASSTTGKQIAVPWSLLRPSSKARAVGSAPSTPGSTGQQFSFVFTGDTSKLQSAPTFDANTDLSQPGWRQSIFSYFGVSGSGTATGGAESPGSSDSGSSASSGLPGTSGNR